MPFLYTVFPKWFAEQYPAAMKNYYENREKLTTPYDIHETLKDLLTLENLSDENLDTRAVDLKSLRPRGISLFLPIPVERTCEDASIDLHWCVCYPKVQVPLDDPIVDKAATALLTHLNGLLVSEFKCAPLELQKILSAESRVNSSKLNEQEKLKGRNILDIGITVETRPGEAVFEATLVLNPVTSDWKVSGAVSRINLHGNQSSCTDDSFLKQYCFCLDT